MSSIGAVPGVGGSETVQLYGFDDDSPPPMTPTGNADYRLRQVNFDGSVQFTPPVAVPVPEPAPMLACSPDSELWSHSHDAEA